MGSVWPSGWTWPTSRPSTHGRHRHRKSWGRVDVLINNASIFATIEKGPFDEIPLAQWEHVLRVNVTGTYLCARAVAAHMRRAGFGRIINISSDAVTRGTVNYLHYVTSKSAVIGMTNSLARELGGYGITVNCVRPGSVATEVERTVNPTAEVRERAASAAVHPTRNGPHRPGRHHALPGHAGLRVHHRPDDRLRRRLHPQQLDRTSPIGQATTAEENRAQ